MSLNDKLMQGPDFTSTLVGVMTRFRQAPIPLMSDIEFMFHQVEVAPDHCDALRFLEWPENEMERQPQDYRLKVFPCGAVCSPSCAGYALRRTAQDNEGLFPPEVIETVNRNFYVDDSLELVTDEDSAVSFVPKLGPLLPSAGFHLTMRLSTSSNLRATIPESGRAKSIKDLQLGVMPSQRALGVKWNLESDTFGFKVKVKEKPPTRRGILSLVSSVYNPLGFASPFVLPAKVILQNLCFRGLKWEEVVPEEHLKNWQQWLRDLQRLEKFSANRCFKPCGFGDASSCELHHFSDASQVGFGTVTYLRFGNDSGKIHCTLVMSKARVFALKRITIRRLKLYAAAVSQT